MAIDTVAGLLDFNASLDISKITDHAIKIKIERFIERQNLDAHSSFDPTRFLSMDLSSIIYGLSPVIFMGTNEWAIKRLLDLDSLDKKTDYYTHRVNCISERVKGRVAFIIIPEKDFVMDRIAKRRLYTDDMDHSLAKLTDAAQAKGNVFVYDNFINALPFWASEDDYAYADSHLLGRDYLSIFFETLDGLGLNSSAIRNNFVIQKARSYGDLNYKFGSALIEHEYYLIPYFLDKSQLLRSGSSSFESPLGKTVQKFMNPNATIKASIEIFGDSHSSIFDQFRLTYLFASIFEKCSFHWVPWGGIPEEFSSDADFVIMEMSQRFVYT
ncbi:hypothetical protein [Methylobacterium sp. Leaf399]|uniref:hypothetical protein n=1 Tax=Methylobacterium sp. Leaf399 TaxID=1736364 RepID=UPI0012E3C6B9|nr:hypothetical protein [Methylobacterium sp. Leaf399]